MIELFYTLSFLFISVYFYKQVSMRPDAPEAYVLLFFFLYFSSASLGEEFLPVSVEQEIRYFTFGLVSALSIVLGYRITNNKTLNFLGGYNFERPLYSRLVILYIFFSAPFFLYEAYFVLSYYVTTSTSYGDLHSLRRSVIFFGNPSIMLGTGSVALAYLKGEKKYLLILFFVVVYALLIGARGVAVLLCLSLIPLYFTGREKKSFFLPVLIFLMIGLASLYGNVRAQLSQGPVFFTNYIMDSVVSNPARIFLPIDGNEFVNVSVTAKSAIVDGVGYEYPGVNYIRGLVKAIPLVGRLVGSEGNLGRYLKEEYSEALIEYGVIGGSGDVTMLGVEAYSVAGFLSLVIIMTMFGFVLRLLYNNGKYHGGLHRVLYVVWFPLLTLGVQRTTFESLVYSLVKQHGLVVVFVVVFYSICRVLSGQRFRVRRNRP